MARATSEDDDPKPTEYKGPSGAIRNSNWLTNEDIPHDKDTLVTIESVNMRLGVKFQGGRKKPKAYSLKFAGRDRELLVNATHKRVLNLLSGSNMCGAWFGLQVWLYVDPDVQRPDGTIGPAVRIRAKKVAGSADKVDGNNGDEPTSHELLAQECGKLAKDLGMTGDAVRAWLKDNNVEGEFTKWRDLDEPTLTKVKAGLAKVAAP